MRKRSGSDREDTCRRTGPQPARSPRETPGQQGTTAANEPAARQPRPLGRRTSGGRPESSLKARAEGERDEGRCRTKADTRGAPSAGRLDLASLLEEGKEPISVAADVPLPSGTAEVLGCLRDEAGSVKGGHGGAEQLGATRPAGGDLLGAPAVLADGDQQRDMRWVELDHGPQEQLQLVDFGRGVAADGGRCDLGEQPALVVAGGLGGGFPGPADDLGDDGVVLDEATQLLLGEAGQLLEGARPVNCLCLPAASDGQVEGAGFPG